MTDKRTFSRIIFSALAHIEVGGHRLSCKVHDLSLKGALVELSHVPEATWLRPGVACQLQLELDRDGDSIFMSAEISHIEGRRLGMTCQSIDLDSITHLRRLVELNLGDTELLNRELTGLVLHE